LGGGKVARRRRIKVDGASTAGNAFGGLEADVAAFAMAHPHARAVEGRRAQDNGGMGANGRRNEQSRAGPWRSGDEDAIGADRPVAAVAASMHHDDGDLQRWRGRAENHARRAPEPRDEDHDALAALVIGLGPGIAIVGG
jgi:hypothetical protein